MARPKPTARSAAKRPGTAKRSSASVSPIRALTPVSTSESATLDVVRDLIAEVRDLRDGMQRLSTEIEKLWARDRLHSRSAPPLPKPGRKAAPVRGSANGRPGGGGKGRGKPGTTGGRSKPGTTGARSKPAGGPRSKAGPARRPSGPSGPHKRSAASSRGATKRSAPVQRKPAGAAKTKRTRTAKLRARR